MSQPNKIISKINNVVEVSKSYNGGTTEDIAVNVNNATDTITANLTEQSKKSIGSKVGLNVDSSTYIMTLQLLNKDGELLSEGTVDLPLESMVIGATYSNGIIKFTLKNGETLDVGISDLISGLVPDSRTINGKPLSSDITLTAEDVGASSPTNMVTTDTEQTITGLKTFNNNIVLDSGKTINCIINGEKRIAIGHTGSTLQLGNQWTTITCYSGFKPIYDRSQSLGQSGQRWGDLYLAGNLSDGTNSIKIADIVALQTQVGNIDTLLTALNSGEGV